MKIFENIRMHFKNDGRLKKSIAINIAMKPIGMVVSLLYVPLLLKYLGSEQYGIWVTILSIINWINYFDIGIGNGLRNMLTEELAQKEFSKAKSSVSTAYVSLSVISSVALMIASVFVLLLNWKTVFNTNINVQIPLWISVAFICINFVMSLQKIECYALQKSEIESYGTVLTQILNLIVVFCFYKFSAANSSLMIMAIVFGLTNLFVNILFSLLIWHKHAYLRPSIQKYEKEKLHDICSIGIKFFFIQIAVLVLNTTDNLIITRLFSPSEVTPYSTVFKAYGVFNSIFSAVTVTLWSRYTVAMVNKDYKWIKKTINKMKLIGLVISLLMIISIPFYQHVSDLWLGSHLNYDYGLVTCMVIYYICIIYSGVYCSALNGMGEINVQLIVSVIAAVINIPLSIFFARSCHMATTGVCLGTVISIAICDIAYTIQVHYMYKKFDAESIE